MAEQFVVEQEVGAFDKNAVKRIAGRVVLVHGIRCADVRVFAPGSAGKLVATREGICFSIEKLPALAKLVDEMIVACGAGESQEGQDGQ